MNKIEQQEIKVEVECKAISVNALWKRGKGKRLYKSDDYLQFESDMMRLLPKKPMIKGDISVSYVFHLKNAGRTDVDNLSKALSDVLIKKGYFEDDRKIWWIFLQKKKAEKDKIEISILPIK